LATEIISADSMQFYKGMSIGTSAPAALELTRVKHHFVGFLDPSEDFSAGRFEIMAREIVASLNAKGKVAVVVGGSGLYVSALIDGLFQGPSKDESIRKRLQDEAEEYGVPGLYARLENIDPDYARIINRNDLRRIVRALEVFERTGAPMSVLHREHRESAPSIEAVQVALDCPRNELYRRINVRVDRMLREGFVGEVQALIHNGYADDIERLRSLGYREIAAYLRNECSLEEAAERIKQNTRRYAKRQLTWFRGDPRVHWLPAPAGKTEETFVAEALAFLD
jgi:tRNA dimethylallyltransferase